MDKAKISIVGADNRATLTVTDPWGNVATREFWAPLSGGYVREIDDAHPGALGHQVCEGLQTLGSTLTWTEAEGPLKVLIRQHARRLLASMNREIAR